MSATKVPGLQAGGRRTIRVWSNGRTAVSKTADGCSTHPARAKPPAQQVEETAQGTIQFRSESEGERRPRVETEFSQMNEYARPSPSGAAG